MNLAQEHDGAEHAEPVRAKFFELQWLDHGVRIALLYLATQLVT
jgi:hypothetical protein